VKSAERDSLVGNLAGTVRVNETITTGPGGSLAPAPDAVMGEIPAPDAAMEEEEEEALFRTSTGLQPTPLPPPPPSDQLVAAHQSRLACR